MSFQQKTGAKIANCKVGLDNIRENAECFRRLFQVYIPKAFETFKLAM